MTRMSSLFHYTSASGRGRHSLSSAVQEKMEAHAQRPTPRTSFSANPRNVRVWVINPMRVRSIPRLGRRVLFFRCCAFLAGLLIICVVVVLLCAEETGWTPAFGDSTLVFNRSELQKIWQWEIDSGHYPSNAKIPKQIGFTDPVLNPALPPAKAHTLVSPFVPPHGPVITTTRGIGPQRIYHAVQNLSQTLDVAAYPPRPITGSIANLDIILDHCSFVTGKFVRDCLEFLRMGAGLDNGRRVRRGSLDPVKYIYTEKGSNEKDLYFQNATAPRIHVAHPTRRYGHSSGLHRKKGVSWEPPLDLSPTQKHPLDADAVTPCDSQNPRLFHMYWAGPVDDKPYMSLLSFLFTQNLGLHLEDSRDEACRPQFWVWINPYPAAATPAVGALTDMNRSLETNPWAAPFLHPRFEGIIEFKLWNTSEQLDNIPELREEWRLMETIFNSNGEAVGGSLANRLGSKSQPLYDKLSVVLSDMARFILTHQFGGIYVDADTLFLRDWEELWGWKGAFAYRWSFHNFYNTAVLHLNKGSALGSFLFRTALRNGFDFHPSSISRYLKDAHLSALLTQLPDALFDPAWLNAEGYQRERPPQPFFISFSDFFNTPTDQGAAPLATGFDGFFRGAFSYHYHNSWWRAFDPARDWPDLGPRFWEGERASRAAAKPDADPDDWVDKVEDDKVDLDWAAALKRTFESYVRGERPNMYGEWLRW